MIEGQLEEWEEGEEGRRQEQFLPEERGPVTQVVTFLFPQQRSRSLAQPRPCGRQTCRTGHEHLPEHEIV